MCFRAAFTHASPEIYKSRNLICVLEEIDNLYERYLQKQKSNMCFREGIEVGAFGSTKVEI